MTKIVLTFCFLIFSLGVFSQNVTLITTLEYNLEESSGLIQVDGRLITHNDSDSEAKLYEINPSTGNVSRTVNISNATNIDWEDICHDENYIYIGDFGNNDGNRTNLKIYRVSIADYLTNNTVSADIIHFNYAEQTDFTPNYNGTNYDAEALFYHEDKLYVFSKNWEDQKTNLYEIPNTPGNYSVNKKATFNVDGLITGADFVADTNKIILIGYYYSDNFIVELNQFNFDDYTSTPQKYNIDIPYGTSTQTEGITYVGDNTYYITSERYQGKTQALSKLNSPFLSTQTETPEKDIKVFPNPSNHTLHIQHPDFQKVEIYDLQGRLIKESSHTENSVSEVNSGKYLLKIKGKKSNKVTYKSFIKK